MMKFDVKFQSLLLDLTAYKAAMTKHLTNSLKVGGRKWIKATVLSTPIPTWSGASRAAFQKLAIDLGTNVPIGPRKDVRNKFDRLAWGRASSAGSGVFINSASGKYYFVFKTNLPHLIYNESNPPVPGKYPRPWSTAVRFTPYGFVERGKQAWLAYARTITLANPFDYLRKGKL
jgi:hypothetical protein